MKKLVLFIFIMTSLVYAEVGKNELSIFEKSSSTQVELKWLMKHYSSKYEYKVFRAEEGGKPEYLSTVKPTSYEVLKKRAYSEDNIFMIYPEKHIKNMDDRIKYLQTQGTTDAFRVLWMMKDKQFAKNLGQYYLDKTVKKDTKYLYYIGVYENGKRVYTKKIKVYTSANNLQSDFRWVHAKSTKTSIDLSWNVQDEFNYYNIYRKLSDEKEFKKINRDLLYRSKDYAKKAKVLYQDTQLKTGDEATYYIRKVDMFSQEGHPSVEVSSALKVESQVPKVVKDVFVKSTDTKMTIRWRKNLNAITYDVYRSTISAGNFVKINKSPIQGEVYVDTDFSTGKEYYYYVVANNLKGSSKPSTSTLAYARDTTAPERPSKLEFKLQKSDINLQWKAPKEEKLKGYKLYISTDKYAKEWSLLNQELIKKPSYTHKRSEKLDKNFYHYRVTALDQNSNESDYSNIVSVKLPDVTPPRQPKLLRTKVYLNKITFEWAKVIIDDLSHYNVYLKNARETLKLNTKPILANYFEYDNPKAGKNEYIVVAVDKSGNESSKENGKILQTIDQTPVTISKLVHKKTKNGLKISFKTKDDDYNGFELFRSSGDNTRYYNISNFQKNKSFIDKNIDPSVDYFYKVKAYDTSGNIRESRILHYKHSKN